MFSSRFCHIFWGPIPWMIEVAVILSGVVRHWPDFFIILILLVSNAAVGFFESARRAMPLRPEGQAGDQGPVKRDGKWVTPPARELVPGDAIRLRLGDIVPADARLLDAMRLSVDQSAAHRGVIGPKPAIRRRGVLRLDHPTR